MVNSLDIEDLSFSYKDQRVLDQITLSIKEGEIIGILGPNGCGKTTLLKHLNRNLSPEAGCVMLNGDDLKNLEKKDIAREIAVVPQGNEIRFSFTVRDIVAMGRMPFQQKFTGESNEDMQVVDEAIRKTGLDSYKDRYISQMSGGERQRVIIARALAQTPSILLMDEPTLHLDINAQFDALDIVCDLSKKEGLTVVIVSHDLPMVARYCNRVVLLKDHHIQSIGMLEDVLTPENMELVFGVDAELARDTKTGDMTVMLHGASRKQSKNDQ